MPGDYYPAIQPIDLFGLYDAARSRRLQEEHQRAMLEAQSQSDRMTALTHAAELAYKTGDAKWATGLYDASTPLGNAGDYDVIRSAAKSGKAKLATPSVTEQTQLAQGIGADISNAADPLQGALGQFRKEAILQQQGIPQDVVGRIGEQGRAVASQQAGQFAQFKREKDYVAAGKYQTFFNPTTGKFQPVRGDRNDEKDKLAGAGYLPVSQFNLGGTPKDFSQQVTPTAATRIQNTLTGLAESGDRLDMLGQKFDPKFFQYETAAKVWALDKASKAGVPLTTKQENLLGDYQEFMAVAGEETLAYTVSMAASTFTDRLREHISTLRFEPGMNQVTFQKRLERLQQVGKQAQARLNFALKNGIVKMTDFDPAGNLSLDAKNRLEQQIPMAVPGFSMPASNMRIDRLMENRYDAFQKEAALNRIPAGERDAWIDAKMQDEFFTNEPPVGGMVQDPVEADFLKGLQGVPTTPLQGVSPEEIRRERDPQLLYQRTR